MESYEHSKKARRVASVVYLVIMGFIFVGTYISNQQKEVAKKESTESLKESSGFSATPNSELK
ncbi:MAG: hypothetical protein D0528_02875 [Methylococcales bacterium]|nr:MAG: hypothetical protein D0528_02875 [Methylococcales bacterium]